MEKTNQCAIRSVLVTGGTRGIGKEIVYAFASLNYRVAFCYQNSNIEAQKIVADLQSKGIYACAYKTDVSKYSEVGTLYEDLVRDFGFIDTLVNNAGKAHHGMFNFESEDDFDEVISTNLKSVFNMCNIFAPNMIARQFGRIINISSIWGQHGASCEALYACAKGGVDALTKSLAKEFASSGVTVNAVSPGMIDTQMNSEHLSQQDKDDFIKKVPLNKIGQPKDVADVVVYLASESAGYITGQIIKVAGGY